MKKIYSLLAAALFCFAANATDYYFAGDANGWSNNSDSYKFVEVDGVLTVNVADLYGTFKVTEDGEWHPQHGAVNDGDKIKFNEPFVLSNCDGTNDIGNLGIELEENYRYKNATLTLAVDGDKLTITLVAGTLYDHSVVPTSYYLVGACTNNWALADAIEFVDVDGVLTAKVDDLSGTFKVIYDRAWGTEYCSNGTGLALGEPYTMKLGGDNIALANPFGGYKNAVLTLAINGDDRVLTLVNGDFYVTQNDWHLPGEKLGWDNTAAQRFDPVTGKENTFERLEAEFSGEFKVVYGNWAVEFGANVEGDVVEPNKPYVMTYPCAGNLKVADEATLVDVTITIVVDYEKAEVQLLLATEDYTGVEDLHATTTAVKRIVDGQLVIEKNGVRYNVLGAEIK